MAIISDVFEAAESGLIQKLKQYLDVKSKDEAQNLVTAKTRGATPLIMACRNGHLAVVEYILESCGADIEQPGSVEFDGESIEGAPPLWCASAAGHFEVVKLLIKNGARVNNTTLTNSTPLRAACFDGHMDIVKYLVDNKADIEIANRHGHTCLMIACFRGHMKIVKYLIDKGADINRKSLKGNTALHDCAESGSLAIMKVLMGHKATLERDSYNISPLSAAALTGHTKVVDYLTEREDCTLAEKIDALELMGATYLDKKRDLNSALNFWRQAMEERNKHNMRKNITATPHVAYDFLQEVETAESLEEISSDINQLRMQSLLTRERILGAIHPDTSYYIRYRGAVYADNGEFERCIILWTYALDMQQSTFDAICPMIQSSFLSFAELFTFMMTDKGSRKAVEVPFDDMVMVIEKCIKEIEKGLEFLSKGNKTDRDYSHFNRLLVIIMHLLKLLCQTEKRMSEEEVIQYKKMVYHLVRFNPRGENGASLLHLASSKKTTDVGRHPVCRFPATDVIKVLVEVGADVDAVDKDDNTALHMAVRSTPMQANAIDALLEAGTHIDACNTQHENAMQLYAAAVAAATAAAADGDDGTDNGNAAAAPMPPPCLLTAPVPFQSLQCLAAKVLVSNNVPYADSVSADLKRFIEKH